MRVYLRDRSAQTIYFTCCHTEIQVADPTFHLTQSQCTDTGPTSPSADPITPGAWQGIHWTANFEVTGMTRPETSRRKRDSNHVSSSPEADSLTTRPTRPCNPAVHNLTSDTHCHSSLGHRSSQYDEADEYINDDDDDDLAVNVQGRPPIHQ